MRESGGGAIVNISSVGGLIGLARRPAYTAAKHGVVGLTKSLARDLGPAGIRVNAICPGLIRTPLTEQYFAEAAFEEGLRTVVPQGRVGVAGDVADAALYLASDQSALRERRRAHRRRRLARGEELRGGRGSGGDVPGRDRDDRRLLAGGGVQNGPDFADKVGAVLADLFRGSARAALYLPFALHFVSNVEYCSSAPVDPSFGALRLGRRGVTPPLRTAAYGGRAPSIVRGGRLEHPPAGVGSPGGRARPRLPADARLSPRSSASRPRSGPCSSRRRCTRSTTCSGPSSPRSSAGSSPPGGT